MALRFELSSALTGLQLADLRQSVGWDRHDDKCDRALAASYCYATCFDAELLTGFVNVISDGLLDALICNLLVHPAYQKRGIGTQLVKIVLTKLKQDGVAGAGVLFEPHLAPFYQRLGLRVIQGGSFDF